MSVFVFLYAEELVLAGPDAVAAQVERLGCDGASVALAYHRARRVLPRYGRVSDSPGGAILFEPEPSHYGELVPAPTAAPEVVRAVHEFRDACARRGLGFRAWLVALHNEPLALARPDLQARWADGSPSGFALCPSHGEALEFVAALAGDVRAQLEPDGIDLEAALYPSWEPAYTLTLALEPLPEAERLRLARCACAACARLSGGRAARVAELVAAAGPARLLAFGSPEQLAEQGLAHDSAAAAEEVVFGLGSVTGPGLAARLAALAPLAGEQRFGVSLNWAPGRDLAADAGLAAAAGARSLSLYNLSLVPQEGLAAFAAAAAAFRR